MDYKIGSFNLHNIGTKALGKNNPRDLRMIANIIKKEGFDVVALQEVLDEGAAINKSEDDYIKKSLLMELGKDDWDFKWADAETTLGDTRGEGYAFVWNTRRLRLASTTLSNGTIRVFYPRICRLYSKKELARRPYYARFTPVDTNGCSPWVELRLLCVHTYYGKDNKASYQKRQDELDILIKDIYPQISDRRYGEYGNGMPSYTILMGDYNVELYRPEKEQIRKKMNKERREQGRSPIKAPAYLKADFNDVIVSPSWGNRKIRTFQYAFTTLKSIDEDTQIDPDAVDRGYSHDYDHFSFEESQFEGTQYRVRRVDAVRKYCKDDFSSYLKKVSDHIPIMMTIDFRMDDPVMIAEETENYE